MVSAKLTCEYGLQLLYDLPDRRCLPMTGDDLHLALLSSYCYRSALAWVVPLVCLPCGMPPSVNSLNKLTRSLASHC